MNNQNAYERLNDAPRTSYGTNDAVPSDDKVFQVYFNNLYDSIATSTFTINGNGSKLQRELRIIGTPADSREFRDKIHITQKLTNQIVCVTTKDLNQINKVLPKATQHQKLQVKKLTGEFQESVERYGNLQKQVAKQLLGHLLPISQPGAAGDVESAPEGFSFVQQQVDIYKQKQVQKSIEFENDLLLEKEARVKQIESDVLDVNNIMKQLASMVHDQGETITGIEDNVESAYTEVEQGRQQLSQAAVYKNKYRWKCCILLIVIVVIAVIIAVVLAVQNSS